MNEENIKENSENAGTGSSASASGGEAEKVDIKKEESEIEKCSRERDEYLAGWQRAKADFINYKKEELRRLEEVAWFGNEDLVKDMISVVHSFDLALRVMEKDGTIDKGIYLIRAQMEDVLKKRGLEKMNISPGDAYDPSLAEAILEVPSDKPPGTVIEVIELGYRLHGKVLKPAKVSLAKSKTKLTNN